MIYRFLPPSCATCFTTCLLRLDTFCSCLHATVCLLTRDSGRFNTHRVLVLCTVFYHLGYFFVRITWVVLPVLFGSCLVHWIYHYYIPATLLSFYVTTVLLYHACRIHQHHTTHHRSVIPFSRAYHCPRRSFCSHLRSCRHLPRVFLRILRATMHLFRHISPALLVVLLHSFVLPALYTTFSLFLRHPFCTPACRTTACTPVCVLPRSHATTAVFSWDLSSQFYWFGPSLRTFCGSFTPPRAYTPACTPPPQPVLFSACVPTLPVFL